MVFDAAPGLIPKLVTATMRHSGKKVISEPKWATSFFSEEMADHLVEFAGHWRPDLIIYPPLGVIGPLIAAKYDIPVVMQTVGFGHTGISRV